MRFRFKFRIFRKKMQKLTTNLLHELKYFIFYVLHFFSVGFSYCFETLYHCVIILSVKITLWHFSLHIFHFPFANIQFVSFFLPLNTTMIIPFMIPWCVPPLFATTKNWRCVLMTFVEWMRLPYPIFKSNITKCWMLFSH